MCKMIFFLAVFGFCSFFSFSQSLSKRSVTYLQRNFDLFLSSHDSLYMENRPTQFVQIVLEMDLNGKVSNIHLMGVDTDTLYRILKQMTLDDLKDWKCLECRRKTIVIPYFYASDNPIKNYADKLYTDYYKKIPLKNLTVESDSTIIVKWFSSIAPLHPRQGDKPGTVKKVEESKITYSTKQ